jgi:hypothetical protein
LFEEAVDEGGFTVIDVSDDRNIANRAGGGHEGIGRPRQVKRPRSVTEPRCGCDRPARSA